MLRKFVETGPVALQGARSPLCRARRCCAALSSSPRLAAVLPLRAEARPQWDGKELENLRRTAHSMKGSAGYCELQYKCRFVFDSFY